MVFSLKKAIKTPIKGAARKLRFLGSLQGKKSPFQAISGGFMREAQQTASGNRRMSEKRQHQFSLNTCAAG
ncbi:MAG: hypothetical protein LBF60_03660 [Treponema sp.]|jgi:hypothetical protein|nr:hypothetical protein [Treponema sp.]